jgi:hypothetical protein
MCAAAQKHLDSGKGHLLRPSWSSSCSRGRVRGSGSPACRWMVATAAAGSVVLSTLCTYSCPTPPTSASCSYFNL